LYEEEEDRKMLDLKKVKENNLTLETYENQVNKKTKQ
jgi:hypothetical protein